MLDIAGRRKAYEDTLQRTPTIAATAAGGGGSTFISAQLPPLDKSGLTCPGLTRKPVEVHNSDAFALARTLDAASKASFTHGSTYGKIGVLNLASDREPGGGWRYTLSRTQEEALCFSSTLYNTLNPSWYTFPNTGDGSCASILSPAVVVFKDTIDHDLIELPIEQRHVVDVITVAAPCRPKLTDDGKNFADESYLHDLREKILLIFRLAAVNSMTNLVLGAMGCGAYGCPPHAVAREMKSTLEKDEFSGWFETVAFAVYAAGPSGKHNFDVLRDVFSGA